MFHQRCQFDIERGEILRELVLTGDREPFEWVPRQLAMRCNFCDKIVNAMGPMDFGRNSAAGASTGHDRVRVCITSQFFVPLSSLDSSSYRSALTAEMRYQNATYV